MQALVKYLDNVSDEDIPSLEIPTGVPLIYELDDNLKPIRHYYVGYVALLHHASAVLLYFVYCWNPCIPSESIITQQCYMYHTAVLLPLSTLLIADNKATTTVTAIFLLSLWVSSKYSVLLDMS